MSALRCMITDRCSGTMRIAASACLVLCIVSPGLPCQAQLHQHSVYLTELSGKSSSADVNGNRMPRLHADVDLVLVPAVVTDERNRPVLGLKKENFLVYEEDEQRQIRSFLPRILQF